MRRFQIPLASSSATGRFALIDIRMTRRLASSSGRVPDLPDFLSTLPPSTRRLAAIKAVCPLSPPVTSVKLQSDDEWIRLPKDQPLWVRSVHEKLWATVHAHADKFKVQPSAGEVRRQLLIVEGQPGIGKTVSMNYVFARCLHDFPHYSTLVLTTDWYSYRDGATRKLYEFKPTETATFNGRTWPIADHIVEHAYRTRKPLVALHDIKSAEGRNVFAFQDALFSKFENSNNPLFVVVFSSPQPSNTGVAMKTLLPVDHRFYFPPWSLKELKAAQVPWNPEFPTLDDAFDAVGGIPRALALSAESVEQRRIFLPRLSDNVDWTMFGSNKYFCLHPDPTTNYSKFHVEFVSEMARREWRESRNERHIITCGSLLKFAIQRKTSRSAIGHHLQGYVQELLAVPSSVSTAKAVVFTNLMPLAPSRKKVQQLKLALSRKKVQQLKLALSRKKVQQLNFAQTRCQNTFSGSKFPHADGAEIATDCLYVPSSGGFPSVDYIYRDSADVLWLLQVTVANSHAPNKGVEKLLKGIKASPNAPKVIRWVWIGLEPANNVKWGIQKPQKAKGAPEFNALDQYVHFVKPM